MSVSFFNTLKVYVMKLSEYASFVDGKIISCIQSQKNQHKTFSLINRGVKKKINKKIPGRYKENINNKTNISKHSARAPHCRKTSKQKHGLSRSTQTRVRTNELNE